MLEKKLIGIGEIIDLKNLPAKLTWLVSILNELEIVPA